jgi:hypothetical protein
MVEELEPGQESPVRAGMARAEVLAEEGVPAVPVVLQAVLGKAAENG